MSGVEIAGLALGALPICTTAIKEYNASLETYQRFKHWRLQLPQYARMLQRAHDSLALSLKWLLSPVVQSDALEVMFMDVIGPRWKHEDLRIKLRDKYGNLFDTLEHTISEIFSLMQSLVIILGLSETDHVCSNVL